MAIAIECNCGERFRTERNGAWTSALCPKCGAEAALPQLEDGMLLLELTPTSMKLLCACHQKLKLPRKLAGHRFQCPRCKSSQRIPHTDLPAKPSAAVDATLITNEGALQQPRPIEIPSNTGREELMQLLQTANPSERPSLDVPGRDISLDESSEDSVIPPPTELESLNLATEFLQKLQAEDVQARGGLGPLASGNDIQLPPQLSGEAAQSEPVNAPDLRLAQAEGTGLSSPDLELDSLDELPLLDAVQNEGSAPLPQTISLGIDSDSGELGPIGADLFDASQQEETSQLGGEQLEEGPTDLDMFIPPAQDYSTPNNPGLNLEEPPLDLGTADAAPAANLDTADSPFPGPSIINESEPSTNLQLFVPPFPGQDEEEDDDGLGLAPAPVESELDNDINSVDVSVLRVPGLTDNADPQVPEETTDQDMNLDIGEGDFGVPEGDLVFADDPDPANGEGGPCPSCSNQLSAGAVLCIHCGFNVQTGQQMPAVAAGAVTDGNGEKGIKSLMTKFFKKK